MLIPSTLSRNYSLTGELPSEPDKIWTLAKSETDMTLWCNEVLMLNISFEEIGYYCVDYWQGDVIEEVTIMTTRATYYLLT